jgi:hypothetical protein
MLNNVKRIAVVDSATDMRKGINSLLGIAYGFNMDPLNGDVLIFGSKNRTKIKILHGDKTGIWLSIKLYTAENIRHGLHFLNTGTQFISKNEVIDLINGCTYRNKIKN